MTFGADVQQALEQVGHTLAKVDPRWLVLALAFHLGNHALRSFAWRNVLQAAFPAARVRYLGVLIAYAVGVAVNAVAPARGGDAVKIGLLRAEIRDSNVLTIAATLSILTLFDMTAGTLLIGAVALSGQGNIHLSLPSLGGLAAHPVPVALAAVAVTALAVLAVRRARPALRRLWLGVRQGGAILRTPRRYALRVVLVQAAAWICRIAVITCLLAAFGLPASAGLAALVMVTAGVSTIVPLTPGGAGTQQVMLAYILSGVASAAAVVSFSVGMQVTVTAVNALLGLGAAMAAFRTLHPIAALRSGLRAARAEA